MCGDSHCDSIFKVIVYSTNNPRETPKTPVNFSLYFQKLWKKTSALRQYSKKCLAGYIADTQENLNFPSSYKLSYLKPRRIKET